MNSEQKTELPQASTTARSNLAEDSDQVQALVVVAGPTDFGGDQTHYNTEGDLAASDNKTRSPVKKPSGAKRRKLLKLKKMNAGTWTEEKPVQEQQKKMGVAGSSGESKRPRSVSNTPPGKQSRAKRVRIAEAKAASFGDVTAGIKMAVICEKHPTIVLDQSQADLVLEKLNELVFSETGITVQIHKTRFAVGVLWITCANLETKNWLGMSVAGLGGLWEGAVLTAVESKDLPRRPKVLVWLPGPERVEKVVRDHLRVQNPDLKTETWLLMSQKSGEKGQTMAFSIDQESYAALERKKFSAFWGMGKVSFRTLNAGRTPQTENESDTN